MTPLHTERLILRPSSLDDAPCYALGISEFEVTRFLTPVPYPYTLGMAIDWLRQVPPPTPERSLLIIELPGKGLIGCASLIGELGYWIARPQWGRGYGTEAARALIDWHFAGTNNATIASSAHHDNLASLAVQKKLGFVEVRREMRFSQTLQRNVNHVVTQLHRDDWQAGGRL